MSIFNPLKIVPYRASSAAAISASETITHERTNPPITTKYRGGVLYFNFSDINTPDGTNQIDLKVQTTYNAGTDWVTISSIQLLNAEDNTTPQYVVQLHEQMSNQSAVTVDSGVATTARDLPIGNGLRVDIAFANTTGSPSITFTCDAILYF